MERSLNDIYDKLCDIEESETESSMDGVEIRKAENGFVVTAPHPNNGRPMTMTFQGDNDVWEYTTKNMEALRDALYAVIEGLGYYLSRKHDASLVIKVEEGGEV